MFLALILSLKILFAPILKYLLILVLYSILYYRTYALFPIIRRHAVFTIELTYETFPLNIVNWLKYSTFNFDQDNAGMFGTPFNLHDLGELYSLYCGEDQNFDMLLEYEGRLIYHKDVVL